MEHIKEAKRYINNAKDILKEKAKKEDGFYSDAKYVKMAGHTAYSGVLVALDGVYGTKAKGRKDVDWYKQNIAKNYKKLLPLFLAIYDTLHLSLGYDGNPDAKVAQSGLINAEKLMGAFTSKN